MPHEFVYGIQPVLHVLLAKRRRPVRLFLGRSHLTGDVRKILKLAEEAGLSSKETDKHQLFQISNSTHHQGVVLETEPYSYVLFEKMMTAFQGMAGERLVLVLDQIQDPQNLGAILRTAHCAGVDGVILPERGGALVTPSVLKTSAGGAEYLTISLAKNISRALKELKKFNFWVYGAEAGDNPPYFKQDFKGNSALILGSEGEGMRDLIRKNCDFLISIPLLGRISSLNVSVAAGILLFEMLKQRKLNEKSP
jgi:23S rRNA (guanosine2251-2'-O)-methyltransferase